MTEYNLEETSQYIETNTSMQPPREKIRTISSPERPYGNILEDFAKSILQQKPI